MPYTKKRRTGCVWGGRGKVLRGLGEDGHRRRRRIWRACFGRIPKLLFEVRTPDCPWLRPLYFYFEELARVFARAQSTRTRMDQGRT